MGMFVGTSCSQRRASLSAAAQLAVGRIEAGIVKYEKELEKDLGDVEKAIERDIVSIEKEIEKDLRVRK